MNVELWKLVIRMLVACVCGASIGYERSIRQKEAGLRTHIILALGSALIMIVSKYGFSDMIMYQAAKSVDGARIAAQAVSGVGFLGAGVIFVRGGSVKGLTTAAGIWATSGVGLAIGAGMYEIGIASTLIIVLIQIILHKFIPLSETMTQNILSVVTENDEKVIGDITKYLEQNNIQVTGIKIKKKEKTLNAEITVRVFREASMKELIGMMGENDRILELSILS